MIESWFFTQERMVLLEQLAAHWIGTPFVENSAIQGEDGGVCCHRLVAELYFETGCLDRFEVPKGNARSLTHGPAALMLEYLDAHLEGRFVDVPNISPADVMPGDLLVIKEGRIVKHVGLALLGGRFIHVLRGTGVMISVIRDTSYSLHAVRRPTP